MNVAARLLRLLKIALALAATAPLTAAVAEAHITRIVIDPALSESPTFEGKVFGPDGRIRLSNPAFNALWGFSSDIVAEKTHISSIRAQCEAYDDLMRPL